MTALNDNLNTLGFVILIAVFLLKFYNVLKLNDFYGKEHILTTLVLGSIAFFFILIGFLTDPTVSFSAYMLFSSGVYVIFFMLFIVEILMIFKEKNFRGRYEPDK